MSAGRPVPELYDAEVMRSAWSEMVASAERNNEPGKFTTFIGYEYTSAPDMQNLHRNVIFRSGKAPEQPFTSLDSQNPEDLWRWLDARRAEGIEALAIPHNSNGSNGQMFKLADWAGNPFDAGYADLRMRNEPLVEITQVKGTSETHPMNSPNDEWAGFQIFPFRIATRIKSDVPGSYVREALLHGLEMEEKGGFNPFRFGFIGASDTHVAGGPFEESNYWSKAGAMDGTPQQRGSVPLGRGSTTPSAASAPGTAQPGTSPTRRRQLRRRLLPPVGIGGPRRRVGRGEHARRALRRVPPQGDLRHQRAAHPRALLRRLRAARRTRRRRRRGGEGLRGRGARWEAIWSARRRQHGGSGRRRRRRRRQGALVPGVGDARPEERGAPAPAGGEGLGRGRQGPGARLRRRLLGRPHARPHHASLPRQRRHRRCRHLQDHRRQGRRRAAHGVERSASSTPRAARSTTCE